MRSLLEDLFFRPLFFAAWNAYLPMLVTLSPTRQWTAQQLRSWTSSFNLSCCSEQLFSFSEVKLNDILYFKISTALAEDEMQHFLLCVLTCILFTCPWNSYSCNVPATFRIMLSSYQTDIVYEVQLVNCYQNKQQKKIFFIYKILKVLLNVVTAGTELFMYVKNFCHLWRPPRTFWHFPSHPHYCWSAVISTRSSGR
jgi:hypothetical protein